MDGFAKEFAMELFLDNESVSSVNRLVVALANVVNEHSDNIIKVYDSIQSEAIACGFDVTPENKSNVSAAKTYQEFYEETVSNYSEDDYINKFKMKKSTVQELITFLEKFTDNKSYCSISTHKKVHVFLWLLVNELSLSHVATLFDLHKSTVSNIFYEIGEVLCDQKTCFISWPSLEEQHITRIKVNSHYQVPNCVGFIDTCSFKVGSKRNKKFKEEKFVLQAVCDENLSFIDIHVGTKGKTKKGKVFKESTLCHELRNFVDFENHILGDSEYKLKINLVTPFTSEELLTAEEMKFNDVHWRARSYIRQTFELLKNRFRRLNHIEMYSPEGIKIMIISTCVLHNFVLLHEGCPEVKDEPIICDDGVTIDRDVVKTPIEKRQFLCNYISYLDSGR